MEKENKELFNDNKIVVLHHTGSKILEGNMKCVSIRQILCEIYDQLFKLDMEFTKSLSRQHRNILIETLPIATYGVNHVKRENIHIFLKKVTRIDQEAEEGSPQLIQHEIKVLAQDLERIIFTDLQLCLSLYNYHLYRSNDNIFNRMAKFLYQPFETIITYYNDRKIVKEIKRVFDIEEMSEILKFVLSINRKMEEFLAKMGNDYCQNLTSRCINSYDLAIYAAVKAEQMVFGGVDGIVEENFYTQMSLTNAKTLIDQIDEIVFYDKQIMNKISLLSPDDYIVPKSISELKEFSYKQYDDLIVKEELENNKKKLYKKALYVGGFFGLLLLLKLKK